MKPDNKVVLPVIFFCLSSLGNGTIALTDTISNVDWQSVVLPPAAADIALRIRNIRTREVKIMLRGSSGAPLKKGRNVNVEMVRHSFLFGGGIWPWTTINPNTTFDKKKRGYFAALFNYATLPIFWSLYEGERGKTADSTLRQFALWCVENHIRPKAHPLVWYQELPPWAKHIPQADFEAVTKKRVHDLVSGFAGLIDTWDVFNESLITPTISDNPVTNWVNRVGASESVRQSLSWARSANPRAFLIVNDFRVSPDFDDQISFLASKGQAPDAMGIQAHFCKAMVPDSGIWLYLERIRSLKISLHVTEVSISSGALTNVTEDGGNAYRKKNIPSTPEGEQRQANEALRVYRLLFSHPSVQAITWWDIHDYGPEPEGLLRKDLSPKPAYNVLMKLIHDEWRTRMIVQTDAQGCILFRGFFGHYQLSLGGKMYEFDVKKEEKKTILIRVE
jgi:GH35 family endo-1,4-beta-xylanase